MFRNLDPSPECVKEYKNDPAVQHIADCLSRYVDGPYIDYLAVKIALDLDVTQPDHSEMEHRQEY